MKSPTIALAADNPSDKQAIFLALENVAVDVDVVVFHDGESVVDFLFSMENHAKRISEWRSSTTRFPWQFRNAPNKCDLLFLDSALPKLDGLKVLRQLRWLFRDDLSKLPPIVLLSDSDEDEDVTAAYRYGASGFLCKSVPAAQFLDAVHQTIRYWLGATLRPAHKRCISQRLTGTASRHSTFPLSPELAS